MKQKTSETNWYKTKGQAYAKEYRATHKDLYDAHKVKYYSSVKPDELMSKTPYEDWECDLIVSGTMNNKELAITLGRSIKAIEVKKVRLGGTKKCKNH